MEAVEVRAGAAGRLALVEVPALLASELRVVLGQLVRRLRTQQRFPLSQGMVLGRLDRHGAIGVSDLAEG